MIYAIKSINNQEVNKIYDTWEACSKQVLGKQAVYKSFIDDEESDAKTKAVKFLQTAPVKQEEYGHGYMPFAKGRHIIFAKYLFDRRRETSDGLSVRVYENQKGERVNCRGYFLPCNKRIVYSFTGQFVNTKNYGYEFEVEDYTECITDTKESIVTYLSSGVIKGIGKKKAEAIFQKFGQHTMEIFDKEPEKLLQVKGISERILEKIKKSYQENRCARAITSYLLQFGISQKYGMLLHTQYGVNVLSKVKSNPYILCRFKGLNFEDAENIAKKEDVSPLLPERVSACAEYILKANEVTGSTGMELNTFGNEMYYHLVTGYEKSFDDPKKFINDQTIALIKAKQLYVVRLKNKQYIFLDHVAEKECFIAKKMLSLKNKTMDHSAVDVSNAIAIAEKKFDITFDDIQKEAVFFALSNNVTVISGGPGTGKTTILKLLGCAYEAIYPDHKLIYLAPTGRAARIMSESTGHDAFTAHSYIRFYDDSSMDEEVIIENSLIVMDEFSMADIYLVYRLLKALSNGCILVLLGDIDQLPSVGPGAVLRDIIESHVIKTIFLNKIYRQNEDTQIYANTKKIREGHTDIQEGRDFHMTECSSMEDVKNIMIEKYVSAVQRYGLLNVMCIVPYRKHTGGVYEMNKMLQARINPPDLIKEEILFKGTVFREGDIIMQLNNDKRAANGDIGQIIKINNPEDMLPELPSLNGLSKEDDDQDAEETYILAKMNGKILKYKKEDFDCIELAYAMSIHKSQGSEADAVITCLTTLHKDMLYRAIPYVAFSRGKKSVDFIGEKETLMKAISTPVKKERVTLLKRRLMYENGEFINV